MGNKQFVRHGSTLNYLPTQISSANNLTLDHNDLFQHGHVTGTWPMRPSCEMSVL